MDWNTLFNLQAELDNRINMEHPPIEGENRFIKKTVAAIVELGETLNEVRVFKFWSSKPASEKEVVLEELCDFLHFTISMGLEKKVDPSTITIMPIRTKDINELFRDTAFVTLSVSYGFNMFNDMYSHVMKVTEQLGFTEVELFDMYLEKNEKNHARQATGSY